MQNISKWLIDVELAANRFYEKAAQCFSDDVDLSRMLKELGEDEAAHYRAVMLIKDVSGESDLFDAAVMPDAGAMQKTLDLLHEMEKRLDSGLMTKKELLDAIVDIELSEHNDFFLYAMKITMLRIDGIFKAASDIEKHKGRIEHYVGSRSEYKHLQKKISRLPVTGKESLLVVDDDVSLIEAFNLLLGEEGVVDTAVNGKEALEKLESKYYAAIISDVRMPVMNGVDFYKRAVEMFPSVKGRFIFLTNYGDNYKGFFEENNIRHLEKPAPVNEIRAAVKDVLNATNR